MGCPPCYKIFLKEQSQLDLIGLSALLQDIYLKEQSHGNEMGCPPCYKLFLKEQSQLDSIGLSALLQHIFKGTVPTVY